VDIAYFSIVKKIHANELFHQGSKFDYEIIWFIRHVLLLCVMVAILSVIFAIVSKTQCILSRTLAFSRLVSAKGSQRSWNKKNFCGFLTFPVESLCSWQAASMHAD